MKRILCAVCVSLMGWQALAGEVDDKLKKYEGTLQWSSIEDARHFAGSDPKIIKKMHISRLRESIAAGSWQAALDLLSSINNDFPLSDEARRSAGELAAALRKAKETREKAATDQIDQVLKHASDAAAKAKVPADLDAVLEGLTVAEKQFQSDLYPSDIRFQMREKLTSASSFIKSWQEYLAAKVAGNEISAHTIADNLAHSSTFLLPRSELLLRAREPVHSGALGGNSEPSFDDTVAELIAKTKSLDQVSNLLNKLRKLSGQPKSGDSDRSYVMGYIRDLDQIDRSYQEFRAGLGTKIDLGSNANSVPSAIIPLRAELVRLVLPRYVAAPADVKVNEGEGVNEFLNRVEEEAKARGDMALVIRVREALSQMQRISVWSPTDRRAVSTYQAAQNQEAAGQYMFAVVSYQDVLKNGGDVVPSKFIGERLNQIKKNHPEDFERGLGLFLNPQSAQRDPAYSASLKISGEPKSTPAPEVPKKVTPSPNPTPTTTATAVPAPSPTK